LGPNKVRENCSTVWGPKNNENRQPGGREEKEGNELRNCQLGTERKSLVDKTQWPDPTWSSNGIKKICHWERGVNSRRADEGARGGLASRKTGRNRNMGRPPRPTTGGNFRTEREYTKQEKSQGV